MFYTLSKIIDIVSAFIILIPIMIILQFTILKEAELKRKFIIIIFILYLIGVYLVVGIPNINNITFDFSINIIPILDIVNSPINYMRNTILNIILFIPLGFMSPIIWKNYRSIKKVVLLGLGMSLIIEVLQIFTYRLTDIDDLITNTLGALIGYLLSVFINKMMSGKVYLLDNRQDKKELIFIFGIVFSMMFLIKGYISNIIWSFVLE